MSTFVEWFLALIVAFVVVNVLLWLAGKLTAKLGSDWWVKIVNVLVVGALLHFVVPLVDGVGGAWVGLAMTMLGFLLLTAVWNKFKPG